MVATPNFSDPIPSDLSNHSMQVLGPLQNFVTKLPSSVVQKLKILLYSISCQVTHLITPLV